MTVRPDRRAVLRGLGASIALPWLPSLARAEAEGPPARVLFWYIPTGMIPEHFVRPGPSDTSWRFGSAATALEPHRHRVTAFAGLENLSYYDAVEVDPHELLCSATLTGDFIAARRVEGRQGGRSADQILADHLGTTTRFRSLELTSDGAFPCFPGVRCASLEHISWNDATTPRTREGSPVRLFERLFGDASSQADAAAQLQRRARRQSVLDFVLDATARTRVELGVEDRTRLDDWLEGVRGVERRLGGDESAAACLQGTATAHLTRFGELELTTTEHVDRMHELMALALHCDQTRVLTYMIGNESSQRTFTELGLVDTHHWLTHHHDVPWKVEACRSIAAWEMERLASLLDLLSGWADPLGGTLLDHTTVVALGAMGNPDLHVQWDLPALLAGGRYQTGRLLSYQERPHADLLLSLLQHHGVDLSTFGAMGTRPLEGL